MIEDINSIVETKLVVLRTVDLPNTIFFTLYLDNLLTHLAHICNSCLELSTYTYRMFQETIRSLGQLWNKNRLSLLVPSY